MRSAYDVVIVGGGPVGLFVALELLPFGLDVLVLEAMPERDTRLRARVFHSQTLALLDRRGLLEDIEPAEPRAIVHYAGFERIDMSRIRADHPYALYARQQVLEAIMEDRLAAHGDVVRREHSLTAFEDAGDEVRLTVQRPDGTQRVVSSRVLLACDGGGSSVRKALGIPFDGIPPTILAFQAVADLDGSADLRDGWHRTAAGMYVMGPGRRMAVIDFEGDAGRRDVSDDELFAESLRRVLAPDVTASDVGSLTRFTDHSRVARRYRQGRVILVGDAAHVHPPFAGQGLNLGLQDAANLGWKVGSVLAGGAGEALLDSYEEERRPVADHVVNLALSQSALMRPDAQTSALRVMFDRLLDDATTNRQLAEMIAGTGTRYPAAAGSCRCVGSYCRDRTVIREDGQETRLTAVQRANPGRHIVLQAAEASDPTMSEVPRAVRVQLLPDDPATAAHPTQVRIVVRPDGYVADCRATARGADA